MFFQFREQLKGGNMASKRRYPSGKYKIYDDALERRRVSSSILNAGSKRASINTVFFDKENCLQLQRCFLGTETKDGNKVFENNSGDLEIAYIPAAKLKLAELEQEFATINETRQKAGKAPLEEMPAELFEKRLKAEAILDVLQEELEFIQSLLAGFNQKKEIKLAQGVLKNGPTGTGRMKNGTLALIDGQPVKKLESGLLVIACPSSPYHGMSVPDYRDTIIRPWLIRRAELQERLRVAASMEEAAGRAGNMSFNARPPLPQWPTDIKKYKIEEEE